MNTNYLDIKTVVEPANAGVNTTAMHQPPFLFADLGGEGLFGFVQRTSAATS